jgi:signal transduction histidine kinase
VVTLAFGAILWYGRDALLEELSKNWPELLLWTAMIVIANLPHFEAESTQFTLDHPLLLAVGVLFPPPVAALIAFVGAIDVREFSHRVSLDRGIYNRAQIALSVCVASYVFHAITGSSNLWPRAIFGITVANACFYVMNIAFVRIHVVLREQALHRWSSRLLVGKPIEFFTVYIAYGVLSLVLASLYREVGAWSVVLFMVPIIVAYAALVRAERMQELADRLRSRERLLEVLSERIEEERRDERLRIASDLHDDVLQSLVRLSQLGHFLKGEVRPEVQAKLDADEMSVLSEQTVDKVRSVLSDLRQSPLGRGGLIPTLAGLAKDLEFQSRVRIVLVTPQDVDLSPEHQLTVYQVAKEAIVNALKHAGARRVDVTLRERSESVELVVTDEGIGFNPAQVDESTHFGLGMMRERLRIAGGRLNLHSEAKHGTKLIATIPKASPSGKSR